MIRQRTDNYPATASLRSQLTELADLHGAPGNGALRFLRARATDTRAVREALAAIT